MDVSTQEQQDNVDVRSILATLWRRKWLIVAIAVVATAVTYAYSQSRPNKYTASTRVFIQAPTSNALLGGQQVDTSSPDPTRELANQVGLLQSRSVAATVAKKIG